MCSTFPAPICRHPGEGRGPASGGGYADSWIPAVAGMTAVGR